jgi:hypothetical protein
VWVPAANALKAVLASLQAPAKTIRLWPEVIRARSEVEEILRLNDAALIAERFKPPSANPDQRHLSTMSANVCEDIPATERAEEVLDIQERVGEVQAGRILDADSDSPAHVAWWQEAEEGYIRGEIRLTPTHIPLIQTVVLKGVPRPTGFLAEVVASLDKALAEEDFDWPVDVPLAESADVSLFVQTLQLARRSLGPCRIGWADDGDSSSWVSVSILGKRGRATMLVTLTSSGTELAGLSVTPAPASARANTVVEPTLGAPMVT